jgi:hypothetical protein
MQHRLRPLTFGGHKALAPKAFQHRRGGIFSRRTASVMAALRTEANGAEGTGGLTPSRLTGRCDRVLRTQCAIQTNCLNPLMSDPATIGSNRGSRFKEGSNGIRISPDALVRPTRSA